MAASLPQPDRWKEGTEDDVTEIKNCYCPNCGGSNGTTAMLPTKVPFFREIIVASLRCEDCGFRNSEATFGGSIQERGTRTTLLVSSRDDLNRQIVKSDSATLSIPSLQFEIPPGTQRGTSSTIEGMIRRAADNLEFGQPERLKLGDLENFYRCRGAIRSLRSCVGEKRDGSSDDDGDESDNGDGDGEGREGAKDDGGRFEPFAIVLDDPSGNSFVENPCAPLPDAALKVERYRRTAEQDLALGLRPEEEEEGEAAEPGTAIDDDDDDDGPTRGENEASDVAVVGGRRSLEIDEGRLSGRPPAAGESVVDGDDDEDDGGAVRRDAALPLLDDEYDAEDGSLGRREVLKFPTACPSCRISAETNMCVIDVPHFKEVVVMSLACRSCGCRSNEIKGGGAIPKFGTRIVLRVDEAVDLEREVLKSDTAGVAIPELELELEEGGLDGTYTTVEGLLHRMRERLASANPFGSGDAASMQHRSDDGDVYSAPHPNHVRFERFLSKLDDLANGKALPFTLILSDPLSNSFVGPVPGDAAALAARAEREGNRGCYEAYVDERLTAEEYDRSDEQNEILGLNDIRTERYRGPPSPRGGGRGPGEEAATTTTNTSTSDEEGAVGTDGGTEADDGDDDDTPPYYGTDVPEDSPGGGDMLRRFDRRGPDHPFATERTTPAEEGKSGRATPAAVEEEERP